MGVRSGPGRRCGALVSSCIIVSVFYRALTWIEPEFFVSFFLFHSSCMTMNCENAEEEQRDSFIYPLVFHFLFREMGGAGRLRLMEGQRRMMGRWTLETKPAKQPAS